MENIQQHDIKTNKNSKTGKNSIFRVSKGMNSQKNRPNDFITNFIDDSDDIDNDHEEDIRLQNPIKWNKFALIGENNGKVQDVLKYHQIHPITQLKKLEECLQIIHRQYITSNQLNEKFDEVMKTIKCKLIFVSIIPRFTQREYGEGTIYYLVHIRFDQYLIAKPYSKIVQEFRLDDRHYYASVLENINTHLPNSNNDILEAKDVLSSILRIIKDKQEYDEFQPNYKPRNEPYYDERKKKKFKDNPYYLSESEDDKEVHICKLYLEDAHSGFAEVLEGNKKGKRIYLHNRKNCNRAFNGDIVNATIFKKNPTKRASIFNDKDLQLTGKVLSCVHSDVQPVKKLFLCHVKFGKTNMMKPICGTIPVLYIDNKCAVEMVKTHHKNMRKMKNVLNMDNLIQTCVKKENAEFFANKYFVTIKSLNQNMYTTVKHIYYIDSYSCDLIFLVLYRRWDKFSMYPFGEVVGLYSPDSEFQNCLDLIKVSCDVQFPNEESMHQDISKIRKVTFPKTSKKINSHSSLRNNKIRKEKKIFYSFKYPLKPYNEIAYSYQKVDEVDVIGVHITDIAKYVEVKDNIDNYARKKFFTYLLPDLGENIKQNIQPDYMLPRDVTTEYLSIQIGKETDVISFYFKNDNQNLSPSSPHQNDFLFEKITLHKEIEANSTDEMIRTDHQDYSFLIRTFKFCQSQRTNRIGHVIPVDCFYPNFRLRTNLTTTIIEEELQYLINKAAFLLYMETKTINFSQLKAICNEVASQNEVTLSPLLLPKIKQFVPNLNHQNDAKCRYSQQFLSNVLKIHPVNLFQCESLFPDIGFYHKKWKLSCGTDLSNPYFIYHKSLETLNETNFNNPSTWDRKEHQICCSKLLSITNPLSSYLDLALQRVLKSKIETNDLNQAEVNDCFNEYEQFHKNFERYWKICKGYEIRQQFNGESFILDCVYENQLSDRIYFHHPFLDDVYYENFIFLHSLNLNKMPTKIPHGNNYFHLTWKTKIFIYDYRKEALLFAIPFSLEDIYSFKSDNLRDSITDSDLQEADFQEIHEILENNSYDVRLTSEKSENIDPEITMNYCLTPRKIMRIQFGYDFSDGIMKIIPELWIINPDFRLCLCHRSDPLKYFMHPQELSNINYKRFQDFSEYKSQFIILNRLEGIHQTINTESSFFIHNLKVDWIAFKSQENEKKYFSLDDNYGIIVLEEKWCIKRFLRFIHKKAVTMDSFHALKQAIKKNKMDYLICIQTYLEEKNVYWIGHCRLCDVNLIKKANVSSNQSNDKNSEKNEVYLIQLTMKLVHSSFPVRHSIKQRYSIEFMESPISSRILERNLRNLKQNTKAEQVLVRNKSIENTTGYLREIFHETLPKNIQLNEGQNKALMKSQMHDFILIWGPPGTGKTLIGCIIAYKYAIINKENHTTVLYCGPSNQSVNVAAEKLLTIFGKNCPKLLRVFNSEIENFDFPIPGRQHIAITSGCPNSLKEITLHHIIRKSDKPFAKELEELRNNLKVKIKRKDMDRLEFAILLQKYENLLIKAYQTEIKEGMYQIILATATTCCRKMLMDGINYSQVILDECGMCSEAEALGPIVNKMDLKHIVFIGDHKQLRPIVTCEIARGKMLNISPFERLYKPERKHCIMLDTQYRMHPSICEFPSSYFYGHYETHHGAKVTPCLKTMRCEGWTGIPEKKCNSSFNGLQFDSLYGGYKKDLLKNNVQIADEFWAKGGQRKQNFKCYDKDLNFDGSPVYEKILFINTMGVETTQEISCSTGGNKSKCNKNEMKIVGWLYKKLIEKIDMKETAAQTILVLTQYRYQESLLLNSCRDILKDLDIEGSPRVSTVIKSQGSECDYVIFSTVRSLPNVEDVDENPSRAWIGKYLGFITDENQFNVAITRAKKGFFIIGNSYLLSVNQMWNHFITDLKNRKCYIEDISDIYERC